MMDVLKRDAHMAEELAAFHRDGFVVFPAIMHEEARRAFRDELFSIEQSFDANGSCEMSAYVQPLRCSLCVFRRSSQRLPHRPRKLPLKEL